MMTNYFLFESENEIVEAAKGQVLMRQGEPGTCAFLLVEGKLKVELEKKPPPVFIAEITPIDIVGEIAILSGKPRCATVTAIENSKLIRLEKSRLKFLFRRNPEAAEFIVKLLCAKLIGANEFIAEHCEYERQFSGEFKKWMEMED
ncbi:MAG: cyclic nucleotide-binding domain-containing protein [Candidatus Omnitrophota bacterium]